LEIDAGHVVSFEVVEVCDLVNEQLGVLGESDQVLVHGGVSGEYDGAVPSIETESESRERVAVRPGTARHSDGLVFEHCDRMYGIVRGWSGNGDVDSPNERMRNRCPERTPCW
jgi:hypothetical protein